MLLEVCPLLLDDDPDGQLTHVEPDASLYVPCIGISVRGAHRRTQATCSKTEGQTIPNTHRHYCHGVHVKMGLIPHAPKRLLTSRAPHVQGKSLKTVTKPVGNRSSLLPRRLMNFLLHLWSRSLLHAEVCKTQAGKLDSWRPQVEVMRCQVHTRCTFCLRPL